MSNTHTPPSSPTPGQRPARLPRWRANRRRWFVVLGAMAGAVLFWAIATNVVGVEVEVASPGGGTREVGDTSVLVSSLGAGLVGWGLLTLLERLARWGRLLWTVLAGVVFLVSLTGPLAAVTQQATGVLLALHVLVGGVLMIGLPLTGTPDSDRPAR